MSSTIRQTRAIRPRVGVIGLGRMGLPVCARLVQGGFAVSAHDVRSEQRAAAVDAGAMWGESVRALAADAQVVVTVLPGAADVAAIVDELVEAMVSGSTWIDMSTASPEVALAVAAAAAPRRVHVLDAPVSGGPEDARGGHLLSFVGGGQDDLEAQRAVLEAVADRIVHVGPGGSGYTVKLLANLLWFGQAVAAAEAMTLARRAGLDLDVVRSAVGQSAAASSFLANDADALRRGDDLTSFSLARCCDQLSSVLALGHELAVPLDLASVVSDLHRHALERYGDVDGELLGARFVAERAGVSLKRMEKAD